MRQKEIMEGYVFVLPFILGLIIFFFFPLFVSIKLSFGKLEKVLGFQIIWLGVENYLRAFLVDTNFIPMFINVVKQNNNLKVEYKKYKNEPIKLEQFIGKEEAMSIVSEIKNKNDYLYKRLENDFVDNLKKVELRVKFYDILNERLKIEIEQLKQTERV